MPAKTLSPLLPGVCTHYRDNESSCLTLLSAAGAPAETDIMIQAVIPKQVMQEASVEGKSCSSLYTIINNCPLFFIDSEEHHQSHKTVVAPPISSMNAASQAYDPMSLMFSSSHSLRCKTRSAATA